jgi:hypothetical protein
MAAIWSIKIYLLFALKLLLSIIHYIVSEKLAYGTHLLRVATCVWLRVLLRDNCDAVLFCILNAEDIRRLRSVSTLSSYSLSCSHTIQTDGSAALMRPATRVRPHVQYDACGKTTGYHYCMLCQVFK